MAEKHHSDTKKLNYYISEIMTKLIDTISNTDKQEKNIIDISSKISNYEDRLEKLSMKETQTQTLSLNTTENLSKFSADENRLEKLSIANINKFETAMKEHE